MKIDFKLRISGRHKFKFILGIILLFILIFLISEDESIYCNRNEDTCILERKLLLTGLKYKKSMIPPSKIDSVTERLKRRRKVYYGTFVCIKHKYSKEDCFFKKSVSTYNIDLNKQIATDIKRQLKSKKNIIQYQNKYK